MTKIPRRQFLHLATGAAALPALSQIARAQAYPTRPVRILVGFAAAGGNDIVARIMGQWLSEKLGQQFIIENRPGAGTNIATEAALRAPSDGYTLFLASPASAINATLYENLSFNFVRDSAPVAGITSTPNLMVVHPSVPAKTVAEFIAYAKANPGNLNMASAGNGSSGHVSGELFKMMAGVNLVHVPYRGNGPALTDVLGGQVQVMFPSAPSAIEYVRAGTLRGLAVTTAKRSPALPDVPALDETVPGYEALQWYGIVAPRNTPAQIVDKLASPSMAAGGVRCLGHRMVGAIVDDNVLEIEGAQSREAGDIDAELVGIGSPLMMGIDAAFRAKEMLGRACVEFIHRQRLDARQNVNAAEIGGNCNGATHSAV